MITPILSHPGRDDSTTGIAATLARKSTADRGGRARAGGAGGAFGVGSPHLDACRVRRQQLGRHRRRARSAKEPQAGRPDQHHPGHPATDGRDQHGPGAPGLLPRHPAAGRRGPRPVRRRHVLDQRRAPADRFQAEPGRCRGDQPEHRAARLALPGGRPALRPHGDLARWHARRGLRVDRERRPHPRHPHGPGGGPIPLGRLAPREQLLRRRGADLPRQHRARLHPRGRAAARTRPRANATSRSSTRTPTGSSSGSTWARSSSEAGLPEHELRGQAHGALAEREVRLPPGVVLPRFRGVRLGPAPRHPRRSPAEPGPGNSRASSTCSTPRTTASR